ncbi:Helix-turn-helix domain-containing protein, partial [Dysosmobacter welbionis]
PVRRDDLAPGAELLHSHLVLSQGTGLVGADDGHAAQALHRLELADDGVLPGHLLGAEGQYDGDDGAEGLRNGGHCQGHGKEEGVHHILAPQEHTDGKEEGADDQNADGELAAELVQAHLKRGLFLLRALQQGGDPAHLC